MKSLFIVFLSFSFFIFKLYSQDKELNKIGSDVIDFLIANPQSIDTNNFIDSVVLDIFDYVLYTSDERDHELIHTGENSTSFILNNTDDQHAKIHLDPTTEMLYLMVDNNIFPISMEIVKHVRLSKTDSHDFLIPYDLNKLEQKITQNIEGDGIIAVFTCNKAAKLHEGMDFNKDFDNIKRTFRKDEPIYIVIKSNQVNFLASTSSNLHLKVCDYYDNPIFEKSASTIVTNEYGYFWWILNAQPGIYKIHIIYNDKSDIDIPIGRKHQLEIIEVLKV